MNPNKLEPLIAEKMMLSANLLNAERGMMQARQAMEFYALRLAEVELDIESCCKPPTPIENPA